MTDAQFTALIAATLLSNPEYSDYTRLDAIEEAEALIEIAKDRIYAAEEEKLLKDIEQDREDREAEAQRDREEEEIKDQEARAAAHAAMMAEGDRIA